MRPGNHLFALKPSHGSAGLAVFALTLAAPAQVELHQIDGDERLSLYGRSVCGVGDLNGDGFAEFMAGASNSSTSATGYARVYSGVDGSVLYDMSPVIPGATEHTVGAGGDVNADGVPDFAVGLPQASTSGGSNVGWLRVFSGLDGSTLHTFEGLLPLDFFGARSSLAGDLDQDGHDDILVLAPRYGPSAGIPGRCVVFSGADGSVLRTIEEPTIPRFATDADYAGDTNGDGVVDLVIGSRVDGVMGPFGGSVRIYSGSDGALLHIVYGDTFAGQFGFDVSGVGDVNLDGYDDVIGGAYQTLYPLLDEAYAKVISGFDGSVLYHFETADPMVRLVGGAVSGPGDVNRDGYPDLLIRTDEGFTVIFDIYGNISLYERSGARLYSGRDGSVLQSLGSDVTWTRNLVELAGAGDVNGDGTLDVMIGHGFASKIENQAGAVRVFAGVEDEFPEFCNGDGGDQMGCTDCPCSNNATPETVGGCMNSAGRSARLLAFGTPSATSDQLRMELTGGASDAFAILSSGDNLAPANAANPCFGQNSGVSFLGFDGLRCTVGNVQRHGTRATNSTGGVGQTTPGWGPPSGPAGGLIAQGGFTAGQTRHYQVVYREEVTAGCGTGLNTSQAVTVMFLP